MPVIAPWTKRIWAWINSNSAVHPVEPVELLDGTLVEDSLGLGMLEELVDGLRNEPDREVMVAVVAEYGLEEAEAGSILHHVAGFVDDEDDILARRLRAFVDERDEELYQEARLSTDAPLLLSKIEVDEVFVAYVERQSGRPLKRGEAGR